jgi:hypothetical protein
MLWLSLVILYGCSGRPLPTLPSSAPVQHILSVPSFMQGQFVPGSLASSIPGNTVVVQPTYGEHVYLRPDQAVILYASDIFLRDEASWNARWPLMQDYMRSFENQVVGILPLDEPVTQGTASKLADAVSFVHSKGYRVFETEAAAAIWTWKLERPSGIDYWMVDCYHDSGGHWRGVSDCGDFYALHPEIDVLIGPWLDDHSVWTQMAQGRRGLLWWK